MLYIDPDECIDCGACVDPCPGDAIYAEEDVPKGETAFIEINHLYFQDRKAARAKVDQLAAAIVAARVRLRGDPAERRADAGQPADNLLWPDALRQSRWASSSGAAPPLRRGRGPRHDPGLV